MGLDVAVPFVGLSTGLDVAVPFVGLSTAQRSWQELSSVQRCPNLWPPALQSGGCSRGPAARTACD